MSRQFIYRSPLGELPLLPKLNAYDFLLSSFTEQRLFLAKPMYLDIPTGKRLTTRQLVERVSHLSRALYHHPKPSRARTSPGTTEIRAVAIFSYSHLDYPTVVLSCMAAGVPFAPVPSTSTVAEARYMFELAQATLCITHPSLLGRALEAGLHEDQIVLTDPHPEWGGETLAALVEKGQGLEDFRSTDGKHPIPAHGLSHILFSSGSTGNPKGVMITHSNLINSLAQTMSHSSKALRALEMAGMKPPVEPGNTVMIGILPMYHTYGLTVYITRFALTGGTVCILPRWDIHLFLQSIERYKATSLTLVPTLVTQLLDSAHLITQRDLSSVKAVITGAAAISEAPKQRLIALLASRGAFNGNASKASMSNGYGMSEATVGITCWPVAGMPCGPAKPGSVGVLLPGNEARIVRTGWTDPEGVDSEPGQSGELLLRGGAVMQGYLRNKRATEEAFTPGGWLKTGDELRIDKDGHLFYIDRLKDTFKNRGKQVAPSEISTLIIQTLSDIIADCVVIGMPAPASRAQNGDEAWAFVRLTSIAAAKVKEGGVRKEEERRIAEQIKAVVKSKLGKQKWVKEVRFVKEFPQGPSGKVLVRQVRQEALHSLGHREKARL